MKASVKIAKFFIIMDFMQNWNNGLSQRERSIFPSPTDSIHIDSIHISFRIINV